MFPIGARYSDFKCQRCFDRGTHGIPCPDGRIGCAVYHSEICTCEAGVKLKEKAEFEKNQLSLDFSDSKSISVTAYSTFESITTINAPISNSISISKEQK